MNERIDRDNTNTVLVMASFVPAAAGFLLWFPGIGVPLMAGSFLQPIEVLILGWVYFRVFPQFLLTEKFRLKTSVVVISGILFYNWIISTLFSMSPLSTLVYLVYHLAVILPVVFMFFYIGLSPKNLASFLHGLLAGALLSSLVAFGQVVTGNGTFHFINNQNFSLVAPMRRAYGFTPEPSILGGLLVITIAIVFNLFISDGHREFFRSTGSHEILFSKKKQLIFAVLLFMALVATGSSLVIIVLPLVISSVYVSVKGIRKLISNLPVIIIFMLLLIGPFYFFVWADRIQTGDAGGSMTIRAVTMSLGLSTALEHWITGVGLGMTGPVLGDKIMAALNAIPGLYIAEKTGIDSFVIRMLLEQGILGLSLLCFSVYWLFIGLRRAPTWRVPYPMVSLLSMISLVSLLIGAVSVGYRGLIHLWIFIPFAAAVASLKAEKKYSSG